MKFLTALAVLCAFAISSPSEGFRLEGDAFQPATNTELIWAETNNSLPPKLWVYRVVSAPFTSIVVSNAMALGQFTPKDQSNSKHPQIQDENLSYFFRVNAEGNRSHLFLAPSVGALEYRSERDYKAAITNVPDDAVAKQLASGILAKLGVDPSSVTGPKSGYDETRISYKYNRETHKPESSGVTNTLVRGVAFRRQIDGIKQSSSWCFMIHFRSGGEIEDYSLYWKNIVREKELPLFSKEQIQGLIQTGRTVFPSQASDVETLRKCKRLTIEKITPYYFTGTGKEKLETLYPYIEIELTAHLDEGDCRYFLLCPIIDDTML